MGGVDIMSESIATLVCSAIAACSAITVAIIEKRAARDRETTAKRAERRAKENRLSMDMMYATCGLAMDTAKAMKEGHTNGTLESDLDAAIAARTAYESFIRDETAQAVAKV